MQIILPEFCLVVLVGVSGAGKTTFARTHFRPTEVVSSDHCRALVADDENDQTATNDAFELLYFLTEKRLKRRRLTVIDATNVQRPARQSLIELAQPLGCPSIAIVLDMPEEILNQRRQQRTDRHFGDYVLPRQRRELGQSVVWLNQEGFQRVFVLKSPEEVEVVEVVRQVGIL